MAILTISLDTESGNSSVEIDGQTVSNVSDVSVYNYGSNDNPAYHFNLQTYETLDNGVFKMTRLSAKDKSPSDAVPSKLVAGYHVSQSETVAQKTIGELLSRCRR